MANIAVTVVVATFSKSEFCCCWWSCMQLVQLNWDSYRPVHTAACHHSAVLCLSLQRHLCRRPPLLRLWPLWCLCTVREWFPLHSQRSPANSRLRRLPNPLLPCGVRQRHLSAVLHTFPL